MTELRNKVVEAMAQAIFDSGRLEGDETWTTVPEWVRVEYRKHASAALDAALDVLGPIIWICEPAALRAGKGSDG